MLAYQFDLKRPVWTRAYMDTMVDRRRDWGFNLQPAPDTVPSARRRGVGWIAVGRTGDDGVRVRPVPLQGLAITRSIPGSSAAPADVTAGHYIVGVDGLVARDAGLLWRALWGRRPASTGWLHLQGSTSGGSATGLGAASEMQVQLRPRLTVPLTAAGLSAVTWAGLLALAAAAAAAPTAALAPAAAVTATDPSAATGSPMPMKSGIHRARSPLGAGTGGSAIHPIKS